MGSSVMPSSVRLRVTGSNGVQQTVDVDVARSRDELEKGLSGRTQQQLSRRGMLFYLSHCGRHTFWMKDCLAPLDIVFFNKDWVSSSVHRAVPLYESRKVATRSGSGCYVLELQARSLSRLAEPLKLSLI